MASVFVRLLVGLVGPGEAPREQCQGRTVFEALNDCAIRRSRLKTRIFREDGSVWVEVFVNGLNVREHGGLETLLTDGDEIRLLPPIAGG